MPQVELGNTVVTDDSLPYVIAEIGVNHEGSIGKAKELIELAKAGGAQAAKFQSYKADSLASRHSPAYWDLSREMTRSQYELFKKYDSFEPDDYAELAAFCRQLKIDFVSTPFDDVAVEFLDPLLPFFKIASADLTNTPLLRKIAAKKKPVLLSTGASSLAEIDQARQTLREGGCESLVLLHCILNYPTAAEHAHLRMISGLRRRYPETVIGYSDHTLPDPFMTALITAYLLGAAVIEKHFTDDKKRAGNDHYHAMDVDDLKRLVSQLERVRLLLGPTEHKQPVETEAIARQNARRSIVVARAVRAGGFIRESDLTYKRPAMGISPSAWDQVIARRARRNLEADHILRWEDLAPL